MRRALLLLSLLAGCGTTPPSRFYVLEAVPEASAASAPSASSKGLSVNVGPIMLSEGLDRAQMVTRLGPNEVALHEYARWADPLAENITRVLAEDLAVHIGSETVGVVPDAHLPQPSWRVSVQVLRFEVGAEDSSLVVARWSLFKPGESSPALTRKSVYSTPMPTKDAAGMAAALSSDLDALAKEIAAAFPAR